MTEEAREARNAYMREWRKKNSDKVRKYREKQREYHREYTRKWKKKNPDKVREYAEHYWARKANDERTGENNEE